MKKKKHKKSKYKHNKLGKGKCRIVPGTYLCSDGFHDDGLGNILDRDGNVIGKINYEDGVMSPIDKDILVSFESTPS
jgi:hypothetical protein